MNKIFQRCKNAVRSCPQIATHSKDTTRRVNTLYRGFDIRSRNVVKKVQFRPALAPFSPLRHRLEVVTVTATRIMPYSNTSRPRTIMQALPINNQPHTIFTSYNPRRITRKVGVLGSLQNWHSTETHLAEFTEALTVITGCAS